MDSFNPDPPDSPDKSGAGGETRRKPKWSLTPEAWNALMSAFASDPNEAGHRYEHARTRLIRFFEWHSRNPGEDYADDALTRTARRLGEGQQVDNLMGYIFGVARMILREPVIETVPLDETGNLPPPGRGNWSESETEPDEREKCFEWCLGRLLPENRTLILEYYQEDRRAKIQLRQQIADRMRIPLNALRIRAHRIRKSLEKCITDCLENRHRNK